MFFPWRAWSFPGIPWGIYWESLGVSGARGGGGERWFRRVCVKHTRWARWPPPPQTNVSYILPRPLSSWVPKGVGMPGAVPPGLKGESEGHGTLPKVGRDDLGTLFQRLSNNPTPRRRSFEAGGMT